MQENSYKERILTLTPTKVCFFFFKLPYILQIIILGTTYLMIGLINDFTYSFCADKIAGFLGKYSKRWIGRIGGDLYSIDNIGKEYWCIASGDMEMVPFIIIMVWLKKIWDITALLAALISGFKKTLNLHTA